jgi:hypothetical protein
LLSGLLVGMAFLAAQRPRAAGDASRPAQPSLAREVPAAGRREGAVVELPKRGEETPAVEPADGPAPPHESLKKTDPAENPPPAPPRQPTSLTADEVKAQLRGVPELDFYPTVERIRKEAFHDAGGNLRRLEANGPRGQGPRPNLSALALAKFVSAVNAPMLEGAAREGLAVSAAPACKVDRPTACAMQGLSTAMRGNNFVAIPGRKWTPRPSPASSAGGTTTPSRTVRGRAAS